MDFNKFCANHFDGNEQQAIQQLALDGYRQEYRLVENKEAFKTILDSMTREQAKAYMAEFGRLVQENNKKQASGAMKPWGAIAFAVFFFLVSVYTFITGYINIATRNNLKQTGTRVEVSVVDKEYAAGHEYYDYTFSYTIDGKEYTFVDSPDRDYDIGDTFEEYIDPEHPQILVLSSSNMAFAFMLFGFSVGSLFLSEKFLWLGKYLAYIIMIWAAAMVTIGIVLDALGFTITGSVILIVTTIIWLRIHRKKHRKQQN